MKQTRFVLMLMYDLPMTDKKAQKAYRQLAAYLHKQGFYPFQQSIYLKPLSEKKKAQRYLTAIKSMKIPEGHIRALILTHQLFSSMIMVKGEHGFNEKLILQPNGVIIL